MPNFVVYLYPTYAKFRERRINNKPGTGEATKGSGTADPINALNNKSDSADGVSDLGLQPLEEQQQQQQEAEKQAENRKLENDVNEVVNGVQEGQDESSLNMPHHLGEAGVKELHCSGIEIGGGIQAPDKLPNGRHGYIRDFLGHSER